MIRPRFFMLIALIIATILSSSSASISNTRSAVLSQENCSGDMSFASSSPSSCKKQCANHRQCKHWSWSDGGILKGICWLKDSTGAPVSMHEGGCGGNVVNDVSSVNPSSNQNLRTTNHYGDQTNTEQTEGYTYAEQTDNYNAYGTPAVVPPDTSPDSYGGSYTNGLTAAETTQMLTSINEHRTTNGLVALTIDDRLMAAAMAHSEDQAQHCLMGHDGTDGTKPWDRMDRLNYKWVSSAENVCSGQKSVAEAMESWWNSPKHRANILKNDVKNVGFAVAHNEACALFTTYWTQVFGEE